MQVSAFLPSMTAMDILKRAQDHIASALSYSKAALANLSLRRKLQAGLAATLIVLGILSLTNVPAAAMAAVVLCAIMLAMLAAAPEDPTDGVAGFSDADTESGSQGPAHEPENDGSGQVRPVKQSSWRVIVDAIPFPALALDDRGNIVHVNNMLSEVFGKAKIGQPVSFVSRNPDFNRAIDRALKAQEPVEVVFFERIPVERRISATATRLAVADRPGPGQPAVLVTLRDLSEQDRLTQMRADFIANASHELRTPLASLRGFVETLQGPARDDPEARDKFLAIMASQAARMTRLIDDLLSLSRVEMRVHLPPRGTVDLNDVASYVAQSLEPLASAASCKLKINKLEGPARIRGDREEVVQLLQNLVHNAIKYGRENGNVEIAVSRVIDGVPPYERLLIAVADDGPGISPEHLPRLTERFYRASPSASTDKGGTGLGLAIVKHIVIRHRGDLRITSELGNGSTFSILFDDVRHPENERP